MKTTVIHVKDRKGFPVPKGETIQFVYIGRPSVWGNPFPLPIKASKKVREYVIERYRQYLREKPGLVASARKNLKGKVLYCYCKPLACHGDVLAEIAEGGEP